MEKAKYTGECELKTRTILPEQKAEMQCTIEDGKRVLGQLKVIESFSPYGILEIEEDDDE